MSIAPAPERKRREQQKNTPWWLSIIMAIFCYCTLKYLLPKLQLTSQMGQTLTELGPIIAPIITIGFLLLGAKQLYDIVPGQSDQEKPGSGDTSKGESSEQE